MGCGASRPDERAVVNTYDKPRPPMDPAPTAKPKPPPNLNGHANSGQNNNQNRSLPPQQQQRGSGSQSGQGGPSQGQYGGNPASLKAGDGQDGGSNDYLESLNNVAIPKRAKTLAPTIAAFDDEGTPLDNNQLAYQGGVGEDVFVPEQNVDEVEEEEPVQWVVLKPGELPPDVDPSQIPKHYLPEEVSKMLQEEEERNRLEEEERRKAKLKMVYGTSNPDLVRDVPVGIDEAIRSTQVSVVRKDGGLDEMLERKHTTSNRLLPPTTMTPPMMPMAPKSTMKTMKTMVPLFMATKNTVMRRTARKNTMKAIVLTPTTIRNTAMRSTPMAIMRIIPLMPMTIKNTAMRDMAQRTIMKTTRLLIMATRTTALRSTMKITAPQIMNTKNMATRSTPPNNTTTTTVLMFKTKLTRTTAYIMIQYRNPTMMPIMNLIHTPHHLTLSLTMKKLTPLTSTVIIRLPTMILPTTATTMLINLTRRTTTHHPMKRNITIATMRHTLLHTSRLR
ncbi:hypothetical protein HDU96_003660 [Phlyctochytrium bullatum]|nr:hypothetical protein HDU96_003660 [Phlyctochytrium bullatum]